MEGRTHHGAGRRQFAYRCCFMIQAFAMANLLGNDADLREAIVSSMKIALPQSFQKQLVEMVSNPSEFPVPDPSSFSRWRVLIDAAYMLWCRQYMPPRGSVRYMMVDSSTQGGRDMEIIVVSSIDRAVLADTRNMSIDLVDLRWRLQQSV